MCVCVVVVATTGGNGKVRKNVYGKLELAVVKCCECAVVGRAEEINQCAFECGGGGEFWRRIILICIIVDCMSVGIIEN